MDSSDKIEAKNLISLSTSACNKDMLENRTSSDFIPFVDVKKFENTEVSVDPLKLVECSYEVNISKCVFICW